MVQSTEGVELIRNLDSESSNQSSVGSIAHYRVFLYYVKARSNVYIFAFATLISLILGSHGSVDPFIALGAVFTSYFLALATYVYNDATDFEVDKINKLNRPTVTGKATKNQLVTLVSILYGVAFLLAVSINVNTAFIAMTFAGLGIAYSHPKINLKDKFPLKTVITAVGAGLSSLLGGIAVSNTSLPVIYAALMFFAFFFILGPLGDIADLKGDRAVGRRTFPIVAGIIPTVLTMLSVPIVILATTILTYNSLGMSMLGAFAIVGTCLVTLALLLKVSKRLNDVPWIRSIRPKIRFLYVLLQLSLVLAFL